MHFRRRRVNMGTGGGAGVQMLSLALFIMLLAFFIVLNAMSTFQEAKVRPGMESIGLAFGSRIIQEGQESPSSTASPDKSVKEGDTLDLLKSLFDAQIPDYDAVTNKSKGIMQVELPFDDFEAAVMALGQKEAPAGEGAAAVKKFFLPALVALLKNDRLGVPYHMDIMINVDGNPARLQTQEPQRMEEISKRMSVIAEKIERAGMAQKLVTIGLKDGKEGMVELYFGPHIPFNPVQARGQQ